MGEPKEIPDRRDAALKRLTAALANVRVPDGDVPDDSTFEFDAPQLPGDAKEVLALLAEAHNLPSDTKENQIKRHRTITHIAQHLHAIQQGPPSPAITSANFRPLSDAQNNLAQQMLVDDLCRQHPMLKGYIDNLKSQIETLTTKTDETNETA